MKLTFALVLILSVTPQVSAAQASDVAAVLELPQPNGPHGVGTTALVLNDSGRKRDLLVTVWYPAAAQGSPPAPYMDTRTGAAIAAEWSLRPGFERNVRTHAQPQAAVAKGEPFPVVLLEHGSGTVPAAYTVLAEGLASSGFIVVATNHPPDSLIAVFPDGHETRNAPYWPLNADRRAQGTAIGRFADDVLVADVRFVLDELQAMNSRDRFWRGLLDLAKVGIVGHSMGGTTAALAAKEEKRISAGVNLDGSTYPGMNGDVRPIPTGKPLLFLATEEHASDPETRGREYVGSEGNTYYVVVAGSDHMSFSDARLLGARFSRESSPGKTSYETALLKVELTRTLVEEFLGKYLRGDSAPSLDALVRIDKQ
jgi:dienelactone hydrolase